MPTERLSCPAESWKRWAYWSLYPLIFSLILGNAFFECSAGVFIFLSVVSFVLGRDGEVFRRPIFLWMLVYFLAVLLSLTQTHFWMPSIRGVFKVAKGIALCCSTIYVLDSEDRVKGVFQAFLAAGFVIGLDAVIQGMTGKEWILNRPMTPYYLNVSDRWTATFKHANDFSSYLSFVIFLFLGALMDGRRYFNKGAYAFYAAGFAFIALSLVGTYSRGAWLAVAVGVIVFAACRRSKILVALLVLLGLWMAFLSPFPVRHRVQSFFHQGNSTIVEREHLWGEAARMIEKSPLFGLGINTYARNEPNFKDPRYELDNQYAHNGYLQIAAETGLVGLGAFLALIFYFLWASFSFFVRAGDSFLKTAGIALTCGLLAFFIHAATDTDLQSLLLVNTMWLGMGVAWAARERLAGSSAA